MRGDSLAIRAPQARDKSDWLPLYLEYAVAVESFHTGEREADVLWEWLMHGTHGVGAFFALLDSQLIGFVHYRPFPRTLDGNEACFLDDLFVAGGFRGMKVAERLIDAVAEESARNGWTEVRWVTTPENRRARNLYDRVAAESDLLTYRLRLDDGSPTA